MGDQSQAQSVNTMSTYFGVVDSAYLQLLAHLLKPSKERAYQLLHLAQGNKVLDVGCGFGFDTMNLAHFVGSTGQVVGVDSDPVMVHEANQRAAQAAVDCPLTHQTADAYLLPFEDAYFDACHSERLLQHLQSPSLAIDEMLRVIRPGGWLAIADTDWGTLSIDTLHIDIERKLAQVEIDLHYNGYSGRQLYRLFRQHNLLEISVEMFHLPLTNYAIADDILGITEVTNQALQQGVITEQERADWLANLRAFDNAGTFFASISGILIAGQKPK
jgi:ubiquinone/menaquinone biosynthesis C-methylase UbiE